MITNHSSISIDILDDKRINLKCYNDIYVGENKFNNIVIHYPKQICGYLLNELTIKMRCYLSDRMDCPVTSNSETVPIYISYDLDTSGTEDKIPITLDITDKSRKVYVMFIIYKSDTVIGKTERKSFPVCISGKDVPPIDPREELDKIIADLREEKDWLEWRVQDLQHVVENRDEIIAEKNSEIRAKDNEINLLLIQADENEQTIERQETTIDQLNSRVPALQQLDPINPSGVQQTYNPESPNIGFPQVIVNPVTAEGLDFDFANLKKDVEFLGGVGTYDPFPDHSTGGIYLFSEEENAPPTTCKIVNWEIVPDGAGPSLGGVRAFPYLKRIEFVNCPNISFIPKSWLESWTNIEEVVLLPSIKIIQVGAFQRSGIKILNIPHGTQELNNSICFQCYSLKTLFLPNTLINIHVGSFSYCSNLEFVTLENGFNCNNLVLSSSTLYSHDTILSWFNALADRTGQTAYTLTIGTTNLNKMTAEEKAIPINKNWNLN